MAGSGGSWKVAYADFVTAMMALFIVLWLMNSDQATKAIVAGYFRDPSGKSVGIGNGTTGPGETIRLSAGDLNKLKEKIQSAMQKVPNFDAKLSGQVSMTITSEGLRVELLETDRGIFFESGNAVPTGSGDALLAALAKELGGLSNKVAIEGHTDSRPFTGAGTYSNWELSADRANAARRLMQSAGLRADQVAQVRGFADQQLRLPDQPIAPSNRRVSVIVQHSAPQAADK
jgi:chemotaxis protein MotB